MSTLASTACGLALFYESEMASTQAVDPAPASSTGSWLDTVTFGGWIEVGATMNPSAPNNGLNFGRLYTDKANQIVLNQFALTAERAIDPHADRFDLGFRVEGVYGLDSQFNHFLGLGDQGSTSRNTFDLVETDLDAHVPVLTTRGIDVKAGFFPTPMGAETIDPSQNVFYSRSYIFDFGLPRKHTGVLTTTHLRPDLDLYLGYTTGVNTSLGHGGGYNDARPHLLGGFDLNLARVNVLALTHMGPEDRPDQLPTGVNAHDRWRYIGDVVVKWRIDDALTSITELNYVRDDGLSARAGGVSETVSYDLGRGVGLAARAEVWRDAQGVFVAGYPGNLDYLNAEEGRPNGAYRSGPATYGELTLGLNLKADPLPKLFGRQADSPVGPLTFRPEIRYDRALAGAAPFGGRPATAHDQLTIALDIVAPLSFDHRGARTDADRAQPVAPDSGSPSSASDKGEAPSRILSVEHGPVAVTRVLASDGWTPGPPTATTLEDLDGIAPGLRIVRSAASPGALSVSLRGLGDAEPRGGQTAAIGLTVDGVVVDLGMARFVDLFDVASVDIVHGSNGMEDGDAALGGMIRVERAKPTRQWGLAADYGFEQGYHANSEKLLVNAPVGPDAGFALFVAHGQRGGYLTNIYTGDPLYGRDEVTSGALRFDWNITPALDVDLGVTLVRQDGQGAPLSFGDVLGARLFGPALAARTPGLAVRAYGSPFVAGQTTPLGPWQSANSSGDATRLSGQVYSLEVAYDLPAGRVSATTAYVRDRDDTAQDLDGGCVGDDVAGRPCPVLANPLVGLLRVDRPRTSDRFSQDVRLTYRLADWARVAAGASYAHESLSESNSTASSPSGAPAFAANTEVRGSQTRDDTSAFIDLTASPLRRLRVDGGLRVLDDLTDYRRHAGQIVAAGSQNARRLLTRVAIDYQLVPGALVYADYATGFRPGGLTPDATLSEQVAGQSNYDPSNPAANHAAFSGESARTYEVGVKLSGLRDQFTGGLAAYLTEDHNHQLTQMVLTPGYGPAFNTFVVNVPKVEIKGVEAEVDLRPRSLPGLALTGEAAYLNARIVDGRVPAAEIAIAATGAAGAPDTVFDLSGSPLPLAPRFTVGGRLDYRRALGPGLVDVNLGYRWTSHYALASFAGQGDDQAAFGLLDMSLSYSRGFYRIVASGRNLLNRVYLTSASPALFVHQWGDPRTAVVELQVRF